MAAQTDDSGQKNREIRGEKGESMHAGEERQRQEM